jgi:hypothetical protein
VGTWTRVEARDFGGDDDLDVAVPGQYLRRLKRLT